MKKLSIAVAAFAVFGTAASAAPVTGKFAQISGLEVAQGAEIVEIADRQTRAERRAERRAAREARRAARAERRAARERRAQRRNGGTPRVANPITSFADKGRR